MRSGRGNRLRIPSADAADGVSENRQAKPEKVPVPSAVMVASTDSKPAGQIFGVVSSTGPAQESFGVSVFFTRIKCRIGKGYRRQYFCGFDAG